jgi:hypothetical protein
MRVQFFDILVSDGDDLRGPLRVGARSDIVRP